MVSAPWPRRPDAEPLKNIGVAGYSAPQKIRPGERQRNSADRLPLQPGECEQSSRQYRKNPLGFGDIHRVLSMSDQFHASRLLQP